LYPINELNRRNNRISMEIPQLPKIRRNWREMAGDDRLAL
jgi:hypothetical protein